MQSGIVPFPCGRKEKDTLFFFAPIPRTARKKERFEISIRPTFAFFRSVRMPLPDHRPETENISYFGLLRDFSVLASESNLETRSARAWSLDSRLDWWNRTGPLSAVGIGRAFCRRARNCPKTGSRRPFSLFFFCLVRTFGVVSRARFVRLPFVSSSFPVCSVRGEVILEMWVKPWRGARATFCAGSRPLTGRALVCACARREQRRNRRGTASVRRWIGRL